MDPPATIPIVTADWRSLFPYPAEELDLGGAVLRFVDVGAGRPILMVHGNPTWSFFFHSLIADLSRDYRCVALDHVGCGRSDKPVSYRYTLGQHIQNLVRLIDRLDLREITLVAHDWGGAIGLGSLLQRRDRFERIVLMNTGAFPPPYIPLRIRACRIPLLGKLAVQGLNLFARAATVMASNRRGGLPPEVVAGLLAPYDSWANRIATYQFVQDIPTSPRQQTWQLLNAIEVSLPGLSQPKLLVWGMRDWCFRPACLERLLTHWPDADVERLDSAGHYVLLDEPERVVGCIRGFLAKSTRERDGDERLAGTERLSDPARMPGSDRQDSVSGHNQAEWS